MEENRLGSVDGPKPTRGDWNGRFEHVVCVGKYVHRARVNYCLISCGVWERLASCLQLDDLFQDPVVESKL